MRILVVEDEQTLREALIDLLEGDGHQVESTGDGAEALQMAQSNDYELLLLDLMLPSMSGIEVCEKIRRHKSKLGILMLTAKGDEDDKVIGLRAGADDYMTKPFGAKELLARVEALHRRLSPAEQPAGIVELGHCSLDLDRCSWNRGDDCGNLTARECRLLRYLYANKSRAVERSEILEQVWDAPGDLQTRTVDMTIANLRQKIEVNPAEPSVVVTIKGIGYAWGKKS